MTDDHAYESNPIAAANDRDVPLDRVRETIIFEAARLLHEGRETSVGKAKARACRTAFRSYVRPEHYPTDAEVASRIGHFEHHVQPNELVEATALGDVNRWHAFETMLNPLERVELPRRSHPEGDALYHSLQVFSLVCDEAPYDEELQIAALLHEVGWAIDPWNPISAALEILSTLISPRTYWLIEHLPEANRRFDGTLGTRARNRLAAAEDSAELTVLSDCDRRGRVSGADVPTVAEAIDSIRSLEIEYQGQDLADDE